MEKLYTSDEVAEIFRVKKITVWSWIRDKKLPAISSGQKYLVPESDLKWFAESRRTFTPSGEKNE